MQPNRPLLLGLVATAGLFAGSTSAPQLEDSSRIVTLYAHDDLGSSLGFREEVQGARVVGGQIDLAGAQLCYGVFAEGMLSYGFVRDELVGVVDVGAERVPPGQRVQDAALEFPISIFHTLFLDAGHFTYLSAYGKPRRVKQADALLSPLLAGELIHFEPQVGHVYLIRYRSRTDASYDRVAKFQVIDHRPGKSVTLRWAPVAEL